MSAESAVGGFMPGMQCSLKQTILTTAQGMILKKNNRPDKSKIPINTQNMGGSID